MMGGNNLTIKEIKRNNNDAFPFLINSREEPLFVSTELFENNSYQENVSILENLLNKIFGCILSEILLGDGFDQIDLCRKFIKRYSDPSFDFDIPKLAKEFFDRDIKPSAMFFESVADLFKKTIFMYQFSYAHYIMGKYNRMKGRFPHYCCGYSAQNVVCALWEAGIVSAIRVYNSYVDHSYVVVPFVMEDINVTKGIVLIDPTSDQLFYEKQKKIRNLVRIITQEKWEYRTDWMRGKNLYPNIVDISICFGNDKKKYKEYLQSAYENPVFVL